MQPHKNEQAQRWGSKSSVAWSVALTLGVVHAFASRFAMNPDGVSYLNLASQFGKGDWASAINGYWSPGYPLLVGLVLRAVPITPFYESTLVHAVNLALYVAAFAAFRFFLSSL